VTINLGGTTIETYRILKVFEFTSDRKMMSVIVKRVTDGKLIVFSKGADGAILPLVDGSESRGVKCQAIVDEYA
jgi:magnesium-transporting ATPase (P-type)